MIEGNRLSIAGYQSERCIIPEHIKKQIYKKCNNRCAYCGEKLTPDTRTIDHIVPLSRRYELHNNFFPACIHCNTLEIVA